MTEVPTRVRASPTDDSPERISLERTSPTRSFAPSPELAAAIERSRTLGVIRAQDLTTAAIPSTHRRIQGLDALRGLAILLVLLRHSWPDTFGGAGIVGVVMFFALSGYLITGVLASDIRQNGRVRYGRFYRNRALRLIPALLFFLLGVVLVDGVGNLAGARAELGHTIVAALTYTVDVPGLPHGSESISHLWTLANEEQFYLVWPVLLVIGIRFAKVRLVLIGAATAIMLALVGSLVFAGLSSGASGASNFQEIYTWPTSWTIAMIIGAAAKLAENTGAGQRFFARLGSLAATSAALVALTLLIFVPEAKNSPLMYLLGGPAIAVATVALIVRLRHIPDVAFVWRPLVALGTISYAAYLWNWPISVWIADVGFGPATSVVSLVLTVIAATGSWYLVEKPFARLKSRLDARLRQACPLRPTGRCALRQQSGSVAGTVPFVRYASTVSSMQVLPDP
jgi:peptidoglycan/LPS O-acetylase OafA/YrhL